MVHTTSLPKEFMNIHFFQAKDFFQMMFNGQTYKIIAKDDIGNFVGLSLEQQVFLLDTAYENRVYIAKDLEAFLEEIEAYQQFGKLPFPDNPSKDELKERAYNFKEILTRIDPNAYSDETFYWFGIVEEIGSGII